MTARVVLDASAATYVVNRDPVAAALIAELENASVVFAPRLYASEVANTLWKYARSGHMSQAVAAGRLTEALGLIDHLEEDQTLVIEALSEGIRNQHPVYDLVYITLARRLGAVLLTADKRMADLAQRLGVTTSTTGPAS